MTSYVRLQRDIEVLVIDESTTDDQIVAFDRDYRISEWMRRAGGALVRPSGGTTVWVPTETLNREYAPTPAGHTAGELPHAVASTIITVIPEAGFESDQKFGFLLFEIND